MKRTAIIIFLILTSLNSYSADNKVQFHQNLTVKIDKSFSANVLIFETLKDNASNFSYYEAMFGINYTLPFKWLMVGTYVRHAYREDSPGQWSSEVSPNLLIYAFYTIKWKIDFSIFYYMRHEYIFANSWNNYQLRNYFRLMLSSILLKPYIVGEIFYSNERKEFFFTYFQIGVRQKIYKAINLGFYYRAAFSTIPDGWNFRENVFGFEFTFISK